MATFGENLKRIREGCGLSQTELAKRLSAKQATVSNWEKDRRGSPGVETLFRVAKALNRDVNEFLVGIDEEYDQLAASAARRELLEHQRSLKAEVRFRRLIEGAVERGLVSRDLVEEELKKSEEMLRQLESDLSDHAGAMESPPHLDGGADVTAATRVRELQARLKESERQREEFRRALNEVTRVAASLVKIASVAPEDRATERAESKRRRGHRTAD